LLVAAVLGIFAIAGCSSGSGAPTVSSTLPLDAATGVSINDSVTATFSEAMDANTIAASTFMLFASGVPVTGTVVYDLPSKTATFTSDSNLGVSTLYTGTVTTGTKSAAGVAMAANKVWTFTTAPAGLGPSPVNLKTAGKYVILAQSAITNVPTSAITGNIGISPAAESTITGFGQTDATGYATSPQVTGYIYAADMVAPTSTNLTTAIADMGTAYTDAAGRPTPDFTNQGGGNIGGATLPPGLYTWGSSVTIPSSFTIAGAANDVWIFQVTGDVTSSSATFVTLSGGARAKNILWQVAGQVTLGANSSFAGTILSKTAITMQTGATLNGLALAQTQVALDGNTIVKP